MGNTAVFSDWGGFVGGFARHVPERLLAGRRFGELFEFGEDGGGDLAGGGFGIVVGLGEDVGGDFDDDGAAVVEAVEESRVGGVID